MTREVVACSPEDDVIVAEHLMGDHQKSRILCVDAEQRLVGIISLSDIVQLEEDRQAARTMREITTREVRVL